MCFKPPQPDKPLLDARMTSQPIRTSRLACKADMHIILAEAFCDFA
jgi:hypothetical protein